MLAGKQKIGDKSFAHEGQLIFSSQFQVKDIMTASKRKKYCQICINT
jgi:hypothetical protein